MPEPILIPCFNYGQKGENRSKDELMSRWSNPIQVPVYFLNADFDLRKPPDLSIAGRDCVHTKKGQIATS